MIIFNATSRRAACLSDDAITTGSVGMEVRFRCSDEWNGLARVAVFKGSGVQIDVALTGDSCTVPPEVLAKSVGDLHIGLYGTDGSGHLVIPTVYANAGRIQRGAEPSGIEPTPETQTLIDQLLSAAQQAQETAQSVRDDADAGAFDGAQGEPGRDGQDGPAGNSTWTFASADMTNPHRIRCDNLVGRETVEPAVGDIAVADGRYVYQITGIVEDWEPGGAFKSAILVLKADIKGETGDSGVYVGTDEPTDPNVNVWIDPDGGADITIWEGGSY